MTMRTRLILAALVVVIGVVAVGALRFLGSRPVETASTVATTTIAASPSPEVLPPSPAPSPSPGASVSAAPVAAESAQAVVAVSGSPAASPAATPTVSPDPNLLAMRNGAFVRRWTSAGVQSGPQNVVQDNGLAIVPKFAQPVELVVEMPSAARLDRFGVTLRGVKPASVDVAVASDLKAFRSVGTVRYGGADTDKELMLEATAQARWVRFTVRHEKGAETRVGRIAAYGSAGPPQRGALAGMWSGADSMTSSPEELFTGVKGRVPDVVPPQSKSEPRITVESDAVLTSFLCSYRNDAWHGDVADNVALRGAERLQLAGNGNMLVGYANDRYVVALRVKSIAACATSVAGKGPSVVALMRVPAEAAPEVDPAFVPGYRFERRMIALLNSAALQHAAFAVLAGDCAATKDLTPRQQSTLLQWVAAGHKLIIRDADVCSASDYSFLPYGFSTKAAGARGAHGAVLSIADPSTLGSGPEDPAHALDVEAYLKHEFQQVGDGDIVQTKDPRWCGHLFAANAAGANGWVHAYARYGRGLIIYDGFDRDDLTARVPAALRVVQLEYAQPVQAELPCNSRVASLFVLAPSVTRQLPAGRATTLTVPMRLAYAAMTSTPIEIALSIAGDAKYPASVSPSRVRLASGSGRNVLASIRLPAGWSGAHAYTVTAAGGVGQAAQATIRIDGSVVLAKAFAAGRRVRLYGIHFDVDSARIQPRSEATIAQIADVLAVHRDWKMRVEGHTDTDGGAPYNLKLSVRRAEAVVADLVNHYHVAPARLSSAGLGLTKPVASNATEAGKALNRRVELVRL